MQDFHRILLIEDDPQTSHAARALLESEAFRLLESTTAAAYIYAAREHPSFLLLDLGVNHPDGLSTVLRPRVHSHIPLLLLCGEAAEEQRAAALERGMAGSITEPFSAPELAQKIRRALRRVGLKGDSQPRSLAIAGLEVRLDRRTALRASEIALTPLEYQVLKSLAQYAVFIAQPDSFLRNPWADVSAETIRSLRVCLARLLSAGSAEFPAARSELSYRMRVELLDEQMH